MRKNEDLTPLQRLELAESQRARRDLKLGKKAPPVPAPAANTQMPSRQARNNTAWGRGWRFGYYHSDQPVPQTPELSAEERNWFLMGIDAGFEALEIIELNPKAEAADARRGRTDTEEV